jgi:hypothetical protein
MIGQVLGEFTRTVNFVSLELTRAADHTRDSQSRNDVNEQNMRLTAECRPNLNPGLLYVVLGVGAGVRTRSLLSLLYLPPKRGHECYHSALLCQGSNVNPSAMRPWRPLLITRMSLIDIMSGMLALRQPLNFSLPLRQTFWMFS